VPAPAATSAQAPVRTVVPRDGDPRLAAVKALLFNQSKKFASSCLEHVSGWRVENGEVRFLFPKDGSVYADFLKSREQMEALRAACAEVLGEAVKIYVTLDDTKEGASRVGARAQDRAANDRALDNFRKRFDCTLVDVKDLSQE